MIGGGSRRADRRPQQAVHHPVGMGATQRDGFATTALVSHAAIHGLPPRLFQHLRRRINADDVGVEVRGQRVREPAGAATQIEDGPRSTDVGCDGTHPQIQERRSVVTAKVVDGRDVGRVVVHAGSIRRTVESASSS